MIYKNEIKQNIRKNWQNISHHPYFGFAIIVALMFLVQLLRLMGVNAFGSTMIFTIVALGFSILLGYGGLASLGTAGFVGLGAYALVYFTNTTPLPILLTVIIIVLAAIILGTIVGFISLRIEGMYLAIITLGLSEILNELFKYNLSIFVK